MATAHPSTDRSEPRNEPPQESNAVVEEVIDALLQPDRAHHDEIGRTEEPGGARPTDHASPREQPAVPLDIESAAGE
jgi:hypothetical protein